MWRQEDQETSLVIPETLLQNEQTNKGKQVKSPKTILKHSFSEFREGVKSISFNYGKAI